MASKKYRRIIFNIGGEIYETNQRTINRFPGTLLSTTTKLTPYYCFNSQQYFFDRSRQCFEAILFFYQSNGILRRPPDIPVSVFYDECKFFELPDKEIERMKIREKMIITFQKEDSVKSRGCRHCLDMLWNLIENPETSSAAKIYASLSFLVIFVSIVSACLETLIRVKSQKLEENPWLLIELGTNFWFLFELFMRSISSPDKKKFFKSYLNWIDGFAVIPYFITLTITQEKVTSFAFLRILRLIRVIRLFRMSKSSKRLQVIFEVLKLCAADFQMLGICFWIAIIIGASVMYFVESVTPNSDFKSIPDSIWWAIITITSVGYGDIVPVTIFGRLFTALFLVFGTFAIFLPILSLVNNFISIYINNVEGDRSCF